MGIMSGLAMYHRHECKAIERSRWFRRWLQLASEGYLLVWGMLTRTGSKMTDIGKGADISLVNGGRGRVRVCWLYVAGCWFAMSKFQYRGPRLQEGWSRNRRKLMMNRYCALSHRRYCTSHNKVHWSITHNRAHLEDTNASPPADLLRYDLFVKEWYC